MTLILRKESSRGSPLSRLLNLFFRTPVIVRDRNLTPFSESQKLFGLSRKVNFLPKESAEEHKDTNVKIMSSEIFLRFLVYAFLFLCFFLCLGGDLKLRRLSTYVLIRVTLHFSKGLFSIII